MKLTSLFLSVFLFAGSLVSSQAMVLLLDFDTSVNGTLAPNTDPLQGDAYTRITSSNVTVENLVTSTGETSTVDFSFDHGEGSVAPSPVQTTNDSGGSFSDAAALDGMRSQAPDGVVSVWTFTLSDLNPSLSYNLELYGDSGLSFTGDVDVTLMTGTTSGTSSFAGVDFTDASTVNFQEVTPNASGVISWTYTSNGTGNALSRGNAVNAMRFEAIPEPNALTLLAGVLGAVLLVRRRHVAHS